MRIAYNHDVGDQSICDVIEVDQNVSFNFTKNTIKFWTKYNESSGTICREYIVKDIEKLYIQMLKDGYIDLRMHKPLNEFQQVSSRHTYYLVKNGKDAKKVLDWENEDEEGIDMHIESLEKQLAEWKEMKQNLKKKRKPRKRNSIL